MHGWIFMRMSTLPDTLVFSPGRNELSIISFLTTQRNILLIYFTRIIIADMQDCLVLLIRTGMILTSNIIIKFLSICDIFSFGNYYINVFFTILLFSLVLLGCTVFLIRFIQTEALLLIISCFLLPSLLFFSSTIHKEGLIFAAIGIAVFNIYSALNETGFTPKKTHVYISYLGFYFSCNATMFYWHFCLPLSPGYLSELKKYPLLIIFGLLIYCRRSTFF